MYFIVWYHNYLCESKTQKNFLSGDSDHRHTVIELSINGNVKLKHFY